jgi:tetratricopeptide (TPR) repeat protein
MKRCPECRRDYYDETLLYCLDDGNALLEGPASGNEAATAILNQNEAPTLLKKNGHAFGRPSITRGSNIKIAIVAALAIALGLGYWLMLQAEDSTPRSDRQPVTNENYLRAKLLVASENREDGAEAIRLLEQLLRDEPEFAHGWALLARAYYVNAFYFATGDDRKRLTRDAEVAVEKALALDPDLAEAHHARGLLLWAPSKKFQHEQAVQSFKRALSLNPKSDESHHHLALVYLHIGLFDRAQAEVDKALELNPGNTLARFRYGVIDLYRGRYADSLRLFKSTPLETNPSLHAFQTATVLFKLGRTEEAAALIEKFLKEYPNDEGGVGTSVKAMMLAKDGRTVDAEAAIGRANEIGRNYGHFHHTAYNIASAYALMGNARSAVEYLELAADDGFPCYPLFENDEVFKGMSHDQAYQTLLARLKQQWQRYNATL